MPIYLVRCPRHGLFEDYPHGYDRYFECPKCFEEITRRIENETKEL